MKHDVIVVGGGFAGLSAAFFMGVWGFETLVLEAETPPTLWSARALDQNYRLVKILLPRLFPTS